MATNIAKAPLFRAISTRGYAQVAPVSGTSSYDVKTTTLSNKLVVAAAENDSPLARVSIVFRAGSRNESADNIGVTHVLRTAAGLTTKHASSFAITRNIQQVGAGLTATSDRETIAYTLEGTRQAVQAALPFLAEVATQPAFQPWELAELGTRLKLDLATRPLQLRAVDLMHKAAFRTGLGNSLFVPKFQIGRISPETLQHYVANTCTSARAAVVGVGVCHAEVTKYAQSLALESAEGSTRASPYKGGEVRSDKGGDMAFVAIAGEGGSLKNMKEALAFAVLQRAVGAGPQVKWSTLDNGLLNKSLGGGDYASTAFNASYSDTGIFGVLLALPAKSAGKLVESAVQFMKSASLTDEDVARGKNQLKVALLLDAESGRNAVECLGQQAVLTGTALSATQLVAMVDSLTKEDVSQALAKAGRGKLTLASAGNLNNVPYLDEIK